MISLERLLDGLDVEVTPLVVHHGCRQCPLDGRHPSAPAVSCARSGSGVLRLVGGAIVQVSAYRVIVLPPGNHGAIVPAHGARALPAALDGDRPVPAASTPGDSTTSDADVVLVACGRIRATCQGAVDLFEHLREPLVVEPAAPDDPIGRSFQELLSEIAARRLGHRAMIESLLRRALILLLRRLVERGERRAPWLAALEDARLGRAVSVMHDRPGDSFTVTELAEVAGMSRSVFAARFVGVLGQSPMGFLKRIRLGRAAHLLGHTDLPVKTIAGQAGYLSRSSFTRAFLAQHGLGPTAYRAAADARAPLFAADQPRGPAGERPPIPGAPGNGPATCGAATHGVAATGVVRVSSGRRAVRQAPGARPLARPPRLPIARPCPAPALDRRRAS
jgi:AraC-like DNA-binding protein